MRLVCRLRDASVSAGLALLLLLAAPAAWAKPSWAEGADARDAGGHTFICEGQGASEEDALLTAHGICSDKICKVCGVEVESVLETRETLKGVDMQRKVVERCRRVRKKETNVRRKSTDCGPGGCTAWIEVYYSKADERAECPGYAKDDFADPARCETGIDTFSKVEGRTAESFRKRTALLESALKDCAKIDVRPTPALMALDAKLRAGLDQFEFTAQMQDRFVEHREDSLWVTHRSPLQTVREAALEDRPFWAWYLTSWEPLRKQVAESKLLVDRVRLLRDYLANKALVFDVIEAVLVDDLDTPAGVARVLAAMKRAPAGGQYGAPKVHFAALASLERLKTSTQNVFEWFRATYPPESLEGGESFSVARWIDSGEATSDEWAYLWRAHKAQSCAPCLRLFIAVRDHGVPQTRAARFLESLASLPRRKNTPEEALRNFKQLAPLADPAFVLAMEKRVPADVQAGYRWDLFEEMFNRTNESTPPADVAALGARAIASLAPGPDGEDPRRWCDALPKKLEKLEEHRASVAPLDAQVCACLEGPLREEGRGVSSKWDLFARAVAKEMPCVQPR